MNDRHSDGNASRGAALERFARRVFTEDLERIDPSIRARLAVARREALDAAAARRSAPRSGAWRIGPAWVVAGSAAALVLAAALALRPGAPEGGGTVAPVTARGESAAPATDDPATSDVIDSAEALVLPRDLELLAGGEPDVLDALDEDLAFYVWLEQQPELAAAVAGAGQ